MKKKVLIEGMSCSKCVSHVQEALEEIDEIISFNIDLENKTVIIDAINSIRNESIIDAIDDLGYSVVSIEEV